MIGLAGDFYPHPAMSQIRYRNNADFQRPSDMVGRESPPQHVLAPQGPTGENGVSQIVHFYQDQVVFITGGTSFIGKVLLEKLLRCCPVKRIYLLIRSKHGVEPDARLDAMLCSEIFQRIRQEVPDAFGKVKAVAGDLALPDLGLSETDMRTLVDEVSVVFHLASTVRPKETFKQAVQLNVLGTWRTVDICKQMRNLCALVHVSTAYSNWGKRDVHEMVYQTPVEANKVVEAALCTNEKATKLGKKFLIGQLNNCTLTNAVTESLLLDERGLLPVAIVRTSIVTASWKDPFPGWIDNCNSGTDLIVSLGLGLLPSVVLRNNCVADLIPVDVAADTLICVAWQIATTRPTYLRVYNCTSGALQPHTWGEVMKELRRTMMRNPLSNSCSFPSFIITRSVVLHHLIMYGLCFVPTFLRDITLRITGPQLSSAARYDKAINAMEFVQFYTTNSWLFRSNNVVGLINDLSPTDKQLFNIDVRKLEWGQYWDQYIQGIRKFIFKTDDAELSTTRKHFGWLDAVRWFWYLALAVLAWRLALTPMAWNIYSSAGAFATGLGAIIGSPWSL
ncbi:fatty acyl-CoA reductase 1 isoform X1 [Dermacentor silvarum]|uniref:fatty acyl-CoA reductase 1 isoform X1 n=2 Tax=Dermacentor silvarum TaxID=543639 RepID=UPI00189AB5CA|nr:fatty acyl-CoA reductase 1 isoform X1 [Dermacentor silvarum]